MGLPKAGIPSSVPKALCHAPISDFGFSILDPFTAQGCAWILTLVDHIWTKSPTGTLLTVTVEDAQMEMELTSDLSIPPPFHPLRWLTTTSWTCLCLTFMWKHDIRVTPLGVHLPKPRLRDRGIMEVFATLTANTSIL